MTDEPSMEPKGRMTPTQAYLQTHSIARAYEIDFIERHPYLKDLSPTLKASDLECYKTHIFSTLMERGATEVVALKATNLYLEECRIKSSPTKRPILQPDANELECANDTPGDADPRTIFRDVLFRLWTLEKTGVAATPPRPTFRDTLFSLAEANKAKGDTQNTEGPVPGR